jgi:hypothetical protein
MRPVAAGDEIAEPLVRGFMRIESVQRAQLLGVRVEQHPGGSKVQLVFSMPPAKEVEAIDLVVLVPCKRHADLLLVELDDLPRVRESVRRLRCMRWRHQQRQRQFARLVLQLVEVTGRPWR